MCICVFLPSGTQMQTRDITACYNTIASKCRSHLNRCADSSKVFLFSRLLPLCSWCNNCLASHAIARIDWARCHRDRIMEIDRRPVSVGCCSRTTIARSAARSQQSMSMSPCGGASSIVASSTIATAMRRKVLCRLHYPAGIMHVVICCARLRLREVASWGYFAFLRCWCCNTLLSS